jgi:tRNA-splicing ligase RtcB (3'-phosphate/5'-hydroxy nucleic acid ligase)
LSARLEKWLAEPLPKDVAASIERLASMDGVVRVAVMPDVHLSEDVCVGVVVATDGLLIPKAVGGDIGCGMVSIRTTADADLLTGERGAARLFDGLNQWVPVNRHRAETMPGALPPDLEGMRLSDPRVEGLKHGDGRVQFGTLGSGNHFVEFQADLDDRLWLTVHSGSRALGQAILRSHLAAAVSSRGRPATLDADTDQGRAYLADVGWARRYAAANRAAIVAAVGSVLKDRFGVTLLSETTIASDHNHVRAEVHDGRTYWVHRKGALSARADEAGVIPGSMGTPTFHVKGRGCQAALCSSSHGAGRTMSRSEARCRISARRLGRETEGVWLDRRLERRLVDEAPSAYKDIRRVMRAQCKLTRIVRELRPVLCYKGARGSPGGRRRRFAR